MVILFIETSYNKANHEQNNRSSGKNKKFRSCFIQKTLKENKDKINMDQMAAIQSSITGLAQLIGAQYIQSIKEDELYTKF